MLPKSKSFPAYLSDRYLRTRKKGAFVRTMVRFATGGVALGVFVLLVAMSLFNGFAQELQSTLFGATAHFSISALAGDFTDTAGDLARIRSVPGVVGASPSRSDWTLMRSNLPGAPLAPMLMWGVDPASVRSVSTLFKELAPRPVEDLKEGEVLIGKDAADRMKLRVGDDIVANFGNNSELGLGGSMARQAVFRVAGIFRSGIAEYDKSWGFVHLNEAMRLAGVEQASYVQVKVSSIDAIEPMKPKILAALGQTTQVGPYWVPDLREQNRLLFAALKVQKWLFNLVLSLIVLVATFNIVASLVLLITEKRRDLGVLLSLGATPAQVQHAFQLQGVHIALKGTLWGLGTAIPFCLLADHYRFIRMPQDLYDFVTHLPCRLALLDIALVAVFPLLVAWWASRFPARRASRVDPVDALRAE